MKPLRIAVTGARGRLAPLVADHLRADDWEVISFSRSAGDSLRPIASLADPRTLADFDVILHLAWSTVPLTSEERPGWEQATDLPLLQEMLNACAAIRHPPHLVFFSTAAVYGNTTVPATEEASCSPVGRYAHAKLLAEEIIRGACIRDSSLRCSILRISNVFGWTTRSTKPQGIISRICRAIHDERPISLWGDGGNTKDYLFLTDLLDAVQAVVTRQRTGTFNVASEKSLSVNDIISLVESFTGKKLPIVRCAPFPWDVERSYISTRKLRRATGWRARHDLAEAIRELTEAELKCV
jgi:UDP-glucose 4-epimerase